MNKKRTLTLIKICIAFGLSIGLSFLFPSNIGNDNSVNDINFLPEESLVSQCVSKVSFSPESLTKIYYKDKLLGVVKDYSVIEETIERAYNELYAESFSDCQLNLASDIYTVTENSFWQYENKDKEIAQYLYENELFEIKAYRIDIENDNPLTGEKNTNTIYVKSQEDFTNALKRFALCFTSEETYTALENNETITDITVYGTKDVNVYLNSTIKSQLSAASYDEIFISEDDIFNYLCYGENQELEYYTIQEYDTVNGVATKTGLTPTQLIALNPTLESSDQILIAGEKLNVRYYDSPITIITEMQRYEKQVTLPGTAVYEKNETIESGKSVLARAATNGYNNVLTLEIYVNGKMYVTDSSRTVTTVVEEPLPALYYYNGDKVDVGISFGLPCDNPVITCDHYCYENHHGVDFINRYNRNGPIYCVASGTVTQVGYHFEMGNYCYLDIGQGYRMRYLHMIRSPRYEDGTPLKVGDYIEKGTIIGNIGNTGNSEGDHVDVGIIKNGEFLDPCSFLPCEAALKWG